MQSNEKTHTLLIRGISQELYEKLWSLRKARKARSWAKLLENLVKEYEQEVEVEWL